MERLTIELFGPVGVRLDGVSVPVPGPMVRSLLALLALTPARAVPHGELARGLWGEAPPLRTRGALQTYVARLRTAIGHGLVVTRPDGYCLRVPREDVDVLRFADAADRALAAVGRADEYTLLERAHALWSGEPFADIESEWVTTYERAPLVERKLGVLERLAELDLIDGRGERWIGELRRHVAEHPLRESGWSLLIRSLHVAGRRAEALEQYEAVRSKLAEELGTDPSVELQTIHQRLLRETPGPPPVPGSAPRSHLHALPMRVARFVGRAEELRRLSDLFRDGCRVAALTGPGGVGKTCLAVTWAQRAADAFPDGILYVDLGGNGQGAPMSTSQAAALLLQGLGDGAPEAPLAEEERLARLRTATAGRRVLIVLDDARDSHQVRPLLAAADATYLVTSRSQLRGLAVRECVPRVVLGPMTEADAAQLLRTHVGARPLGVEDEVALRRLSDLCGRLPLALAVAGERAGRDTTNRLTQLADQLEDEQSRLELLSGSDESDLRAVFDWSYAQLDPEAARMFRLLSLHRGGDVSVPAAAATAGVPDAAAEDLLDRLAERHLLIPGWPGWHQIHDLTRLYAKDLLDQDPEGGPEALARLQAWYVHSGRNARECLRPYRIPSVRDLPPGVRPEEFTGPRDASDWLAAHQRNLSVMVSDAAAASDHRLVVELSYALSVRLKMTYAVEENLDLCRLMRASAEAIGDRAAFALACNLTGTSLTTTDAVDEACVWFERARAEYSALGDLAGERIARANSGRAMLPDATRREEGIAVLESAKDIEGLPPSASLLNNLAWGHGMQGRFRTAVGYAERSIEVLRDVGDRHGESNALDTLAMVHHLAGDHEAAVAALCRALEITRSLGDVKGEVVLLTTLGTVYRDEGRVADARSTWEDAERLIHSAPGSLRMDATAVRDLLASLTPRRTADRSSQEWPTPALP